MTNPTRNQILDKINKIIKRHKEKSWEKQKNSWWFSSWLTEHNKTCIKGVRNERIQSALRAGKSLSNVVLTYTFDDPFGGPLIEDGFSAPNAIFSGAYWYGVTWKNGDLSKSNFKRARMDSCDLVNTSFREADLRNATFRNSDLSGVDFTGALLDEINFEWSGYFYLKPPVGLTDKHFKLLEPWKHYARRPIEAGAPPQQEIYQGLVINPTK